MNVLGGLLCSNGFTLASVPAPINMTGLAAASVLIIGNAWGDFTTNEIETVHQFVSDGGGLLLAGLGWSWLAYHPGTTLEDYPMTKMAAPYQVGWLDGYISDPTDQSSGSPIFHTFYPNIVVPRPIIRSPREENGALSFLVTSQQGRQYRVQVSGDLLNWIDVTNVISLQPTWSFIDYLSSGRPCSFYRIASP
jgi:hypothetical protein